jgi:DNA-binding NarL/FixJ family response regulator
LTIRVVIADDQRVVRAGLAMLVGLIDGVRVVGQAGDGAQALAQARDTGADVVLMDLRMPGVDGTRATREIRAELPDTQVLVLTTYSDDESLFPALRAGARGSLTKDSSAEEIEQAIVAVAGGRTHLAPAIQQRLVTAALEIRPAPGALPEDLTPRQAQILTLIASGMTNAQIAQALVVSHATVKTTSTTSSPRPAHMIARRRCGTRTSTV